MFGWLYNNSKSQRSCSPRANPLLFASLHFSKRPFLLKCLWSLCLKGDRILDNELNVVWTVDICLIGWVFPPKLKKKPTPFLSKKMPKFYRHPFLRNPARSVPLLQHRPARDLAVTCTHHTMITVQAQHALISNVSVRWTASTDFLWLRSIFSFWKALHADVRRRVRSWKGEQETLVPVLGGLTADKQWR